MFPTHSSNSIPLLNQQYSIWPSGAVTLQVKSVDKPSMPNWYASILQPGLLVNVNTSCLHADSSLIPFNVSQGYFLLYFNNSYTNFGKLLSKSRVDISKTLHTSLYYFFTFLFYSFICPLPILFSYILLYIFK